SRDWAKLPRAEPAPSADARRSRIRRSAIASSPVEARVTPVGPFGPPSSGFGFGVPLSSASAIARGAGGNDLSDREQYERAILLLKETVLFRRMSWRLVGDLVMLEGIRIVHDAVDRTQVDFAVLV